MHLLNLTVVLICTCILFFLYRKSWESFLVGLITIYMCCPFIKWGTAEITGTYLLTVLIFVVTLFEIIKKRVRITKTHIAFVIAMFLYLIVMLLAGIINGVVNTSTIVSVAGVGKIWVSVLGVSLLLQRANKNKVLINSIIVINCIHTFFGVIQLFSVEWGYYLTSQLFAKSDRVMPLLTMKELNGFYRIFGANYSPTILGTYVLIACAYIIACIYKDRTNKKYYYCLFHTFILGLYAFSKSVIIGIFVLLIGGGILAYIFYKDKKHIIKTFLRMLLIVASCFLIVTITCYPTRLRMQVNYYFGKIISMPWQAFESRYGNGQMEYDKELIAQITNESISGTELAISYFYAHPVLGVGITTLGGEFIGDSQYITVLHNSGIIGFIIYVVFYALLFFDTMKKKRLEKGQLLLAIAMCGVATNVLEIATVVPFLAFCFAEQEGCVVI